MTHSEQQSVRSSAHQGTEISPFRIDVPQTDF
jgi:hypothetical protein